MTAKETVEEFKARMHREHGGGGGNAVVTGEEIAAAQREKQAKKRTWCGLCEQEICDHYRGGWL